MPEASLWTLVVSLVLLALGLTYKIADIRHTLKRTKDELSAARSEMATLNEKYDKQIQDIQMRGDTRIEELNKTISDLEHDAPPASASSIEPSDEIPRWKKIRKELKG